MAITTCANYNFTYPFVTPKIIVHNINIQLPHSTIGAVFGDAAAFKFRQPISKSLIIYTIRLLPSADTLGLEMKLWCDFDAHTCSKAETWPKKRHFTRKLSFRNTIRPLAYFKHRSTTCQHRYVPYGGVRGKNRPDRAGSSHYVVGWSLVRHISYLNGYQMYVGDAW